MNTSALVTNMPGETKRAWARTRLRIWPGSYQLVSLPHTSLLQAAHLVTTNDTAATPFVALLVEMDEVSLTIADDIWQPAAASIACTAVAGPYRVVTFTPALDLTICGYLAPAATLLALAGISIIPQCGYQKDHLLLREEDTSRAITILTDLIAACQSSDGHASPRDTSLSAAQNPETISIRLARPADATPLSILGARTFSDTFGPYTPPADLATYLATAYTPERQAAEISDVNGVMLVVETNPVEGTPILIGYAYLGRGSTPAVVTGPDPLELKRFYIDVPWHGRGVAHTLMQKVLQYAAQLRARTLWLGVWEHNTRAFAFYRKYGFQRVGEHVFPVGNDPQVDWLLVRTLDVSPDILT